VAGYDIARLTALDVELKVKPTVVTYSRLEPRNLSSGDLTPGLELPLADPLWLIGRQWQFAELRGEDGGSPVVVEVNAESAPATRWHPGAFSDDDPAAASFDLGALPVEVAVEAESLVQLPLRVRAELGQQLLRRLRAAKLPAAVATKVIAAAVATWPFAEHVRRDDEPYDAAGAIDAETDPAGAARFRLVSGRVPDGAVAAAALTASLAGDGSVTLPAALATAAGTDARRQTVRGVVGAWLAEATAYVAGPIGTSWDPHRLEYAFALQATLSTGDAVLRADEYAGGTIDWHTFDATSEPSLGAPTDPGGRTVTRRVMPAPVRYPGMPSDRLWAFEDAKVWLGGVTAGATDLARLALLEFSLAYGNDWFLVPFPLRYGDVARVHALTVTDTFGSVVPVGPSREVSRPGWTVFSHTPVDDGSPLADLFVLPPTLPHTLQGPPLEEVAMFRDEMANLVWGVEHVVQGVSGEPVRRGLVENRSLRQALPDDLGDAELIYRLMTPVPEHWIPFVSMPVPDVPVEQFATELVRRPLVRFLDDGTVSLSRPHGMLLRQDPTADPDTDFLRVAEEEVPRDGLLLTRRFQLARTVGGGSVLWVGRDKRPGQGEGSSGLKFDTALPPGGL
jgi:hypothetical protein